MIQLSTRILGTIICALALIVSLPGQTRAPSNVFDSVPATLRPRIQERVTLFVNAYRAEQWDKLYDLLTDDFNVGTREQFVKSRLENPPQPPDVLLNFIPTSVNYRDGFDEWEISGCSKWQNGGNISASIYAYRRHDDWLFSLIALHLVTKRTEYGASANIHDTVPCKGGG